MPSLISAQEWPVVSALFDEALSLPAGERDGFVASLSGKRAAHRESLRKLLASAARAETDDFLETLPKLALSGREAKLAGLSAGNVVGAYRLLSELGVGGMGAVWLAERADGALKRKVALKLPHLTWAPGLAERMARERDILASLEHPHIARLYDAGVDQHGLPYLALEYIEGQPIDAYIRAKALTIKDRLGLILQVAGAVAFAHSRLVVHRDLKPGNILVTAEGQVRLLDFGIAKLMEGDRAAETQLTRLAGRPLTLDYASPEQIRGQPITTASDVYSLGVVAYELLASAKPYKLRRGSAAELEEAIASVDAPKASDAAANSAAKRELKGDLDAILNKALKKSPAERYPTLDALAEDVRRYLAGQTVTAQPDSARYRFVRFIARHRVPVAAAGVTVAAFGLAFGAGATALTILALLVGIAAALWQAKRAGVQADLARRQAARSGAVTEFMFDTFSRIAAQRDVDGAQLGEQMAAAIGTELRKIEERGGGEPSALAEVFGHAAVLYNYLQRPSDVHAAALQELRYATLAKESAARIAGSRLRIALSLYWQHEYTEAIKHLDAGLVVIGEAVGPENRLLRGRLLRAIGRYSYDAGDLLRAHQSGAASLQQYEASDAATDSDAANYYADALADLTLHSSARGLDREAKELLAKIDRLCEQRQDIKGVVFAGIELARGRVMLDHGQYGEATAAFRKTVKLFAEHFGSASINAARMDTWLVTALTLDGKFTEAESILQRIPAESSEAALCAAAAHLYLDFGDLHRAAESVAKLVSDSMLERQPIVRLDCLALQVQWRFELGQVVDAMRLADEAEALSKNSIAGAARLQQRAAIDAVYARLFSGDIVGARTRFEATCAMWLATPATGAERTRCADLRADLDLAEGNYEMAIHWFEAGGVDLPRSAHDRILALLTYGEALLTADRVEAAGEQFGCAEESSATQHITSQLRGSVAAWRGLMRVRADDHKGAHRDLNAALDIACTNPSIGPRLQRPLTLLKDALGLAA